MIRSIIIVAIYLLNYGYDESGAIPLTMKGENVSNITFSNFLVSIHTEKPGCLGTRKRRCGGSIISTTYVITAAHCVDGNSNDQIRVRIGSSDIKAKKHVHSCYRNRTSVHDISLLHLEQVLTFSNTLGAIGLLESPEDFKYPVGATVKAVGFGKVKNGSYAPQVANMAIVNNTECEGFTADFDHRFCVQNKSIKISEDDGGSPVIYGDMLIGIVSLTNDIFKTDRSVIVKLSDYEQFIRTIILMFP